MIRFVLRTAWSFIVLGVILYGVFFVHLGQRTLYQHLSRIASTDEAKDLGREVGQATSRAGTEIGRQIREEQRRGVGPEGSAAGPAR